MKEQCEEEERLEELRQRIIGLGERSQRKSYYPQLKERIAELEETNLALKESEEKYRTLLENLDIGICRTLPDSRRPIVQANPAMARIFGYDNASELLAVPPITLYADPRDRDAIIAELQKEGRVKDRRVRMRKKDGTIIICSLTFTAIRGPGDAIERIDGFITDITEKERAEEALQSSQQMLQLVLDNIPQRVFWKDRELNYLGCNQNAARDAGLPDPRDIVGKNDHELAWRDSADLYRADDRQVIESGRPKINFEEPQIQSDGSVWWLQTSKVPLRDADGKVIGVLGTYSDITERKRVEEELRKSEERFRTLSEATFEGIVVHANGVILDVNQAALEQTGYTREEVIGRSILEFFTSDSQAVIREVVRQPVVEAYEAHLMKKGGELLTVQIKSRNMEFDGRPARVATIMDITEQVKARERIEELVARKEEERIRLRTILDTLPVGVLIADNEAVMIEANEIALETMGEGAPLARSIDDYSCYRGWYADSGIKLGAKDWGLVRAVTKGERVKGQVIDIERLDGSRGTILDSGAPLRDAEGRIIGAVSVIQDITKQRELEHEAIAAKERAELYIDLLTHDINNMNTAAKGFLQLVEDKADLDDKNRQRLMKCQGALDDISDLIEKVKKIQWIERPDARRELVDLGWTIEDVVQSFKDYPGKEVIVNYRPQLKRMVLASELLSDVFSNLIGNAVKHSDGPVTVDINISKIFDEGREYYMVTVEDDGPGIPDEAKNRIFSRLQRGKTRASGSGLGLYLVRTLVEDFRGRVWVEDRVTGDHTKGAKFVVMLPVVAMPENSLR